MNKHLLICENQIAITTGEQRAAARRGQPERAPAAAPAEIGTFSANGYVFDTEENLLEFVGEQLKKNPSLKWVKYSPTEKYFVDPGPVKKVAFDNEAGEFVGG